MNDIIVNCIGQANVNDQEMTFFEVALTDAAIKAIESGNTEALKTALMEAYNAATAK